jgi:hypothetical protein
MAVLTTIPPAQQILDIEKKRQTILPPCYHLQTFRSLAPKERIGSRSFKNLHLSHF